MVQLFYLLSTYSGSDFIGPITTYDFHFLSGAPNIRNSYSTLLRPFDLYIWSWFLASVTVISFLLIIIDRIHNKISKQLVKEDTLQCKGNIVNAEMR